MFSNLKKTHVILNISPTYSPSKWAHFDQEAIGHLSTPFESPVTELPNLYVLVLKIGHS